MHEWSFQKIVLVGWWGSHISLQQENETAAFKAKKIRSQKFMLKLIFAKVPSGFHFPSVFLSFSEFFFGEESWGFWKYRSKQTCEQTYQDPTT